MRWLFLFAAVGLVGAGCDKTIYRSHEGQFCSSFSDDEPYYECSRSSDLVCINTYEKSYVQPNNQPDKIVAMWLCREACDPGAQNPCAISGEVCCPGAIFGKDYPAKRVTNPMPYACTPREFCDAVLGMPTTKDGGAKDSATSADANPDASADAGANDAPVD